MGWHTIIQRHISCQNEPLISFVSNNPVNTSYATNGDLLTLNFSANERLLDSLVLVTIFEENATVSKVSNFANGSEPWSASYVISDAKDDANGNGNPIPYTITFNDIYTVPSRQTYAQTLNGDNIVFDNTPPEITAFTVASNSEGFPLLQNLEIILLLMLQVMSLLL